MKYYISILVFMLLATSISAQDHREKREGKRKDRKERRDSRMEAKRIGYITEELDLSAEEAQKFWPIYNDFQDEMKELKKKSKEDGKRDIEFNDAEGEAFLNQIFDKEQKVLDLKRMYYSKMESAISKAKIAKLYTLERRFRDKVYSSLKRRMKEKHKGIEK